MQTRPKNLVRFAQLPEYPWKRIIALALSLAMIVLYSWVLDSILPGLARLIVSVLFTVTPTFWVWFTRKQIWKALAARNALASAAVPILATIALVYFGWEIQHTCRHALEAKGMDQLLSLTVATTMAVISLALIPILWLDRRDPPQQSA